MPRNTQVARQVLLLRRLESPQGATPQDFAAALRYMVAGSIAVSYYAVPRMTRDIDVVVELSGPDADRSCRLFEDDFYVDPGAVAEAIRRRGMFNIIHNEFVIKVDFVCARTAKTGARSSPGAGASRWRGAGSSSSPRRI